MQAWIADKDKRVAKIREAKAATFSCRLTRMILDRQFSEAHRHHRHPPADLPSLADQSG